mgnify:CR=1 FL=1
MKILAISDTHINDRADEIPNVMEKLIYEEKPYDAVIFAGDLTREDVLEWVRSLAPKQYVVEGNMDYLDLPEYLVDDFNGVRIGVIHGHQIYPRGDVVKLCKVANKLDAKILVTGHTHNALVRSHSNKIIVNPGSLTGVISGSGSGGIPSFTIILIMDNSVKIDLYVLSDLMSADYIKQSYKFQI